LGFLPHEESIIFVLYCIYDCLSFSDPTTVAIGLSNCNCVTRKFKSPIHTSSDNMTTPSTTGRMDVVEAQLKKLKENIGLDEKWNKKFDKKLDEKLGSLKERSTAKLVPHIVGGTVEEEHWMAQHIEPHQEETSNS
jgi:hypothetical protein